MPAPPTPDALSQLAGPLAAIGAAVGLFLASVVRGWSSGKKPAAKSEDAVVISGAFADAQPIRDLTAAVRDQTQAAKDAREATRDFDRNQGDRSRELVEAMRDVKRETQRNTAELEAIHDVVLRGVKVVPAGDPKA